MSRLSWIILSIAVSSSAWSKPRAGNKELRLGSGIPGFLGLSASEGVNYFTGEGSGSLTTIAVDGGFGYFVSETTDLGFQMSIGSFDVPGADFTAIALGPFMKFLLVPDRFGGFFEIGPGFQILSAGGGDSIELFRLNVRVGIEGFVTDLWSVHLGPQYNLYINGDGHLNVIGANWGISNYF